MMQRHAPKMKRRLHDAAPEITPPTGAAPPYIDEPEATK
jgi:hypothetical protein